MEMIVSRSQLEMTSKVGGSRGPMTGNLQKSCKKLLSFPGQQEMLVAKWVTYFGYASMDAFVVGYSMNCMKIVGWGKHSAVYFRWRKAGWTA